MNFQICLSKIWSSEECKIKLLQCEASPSCVRRKGDHLDVQLMVQLTFKRVKNYILKSSSAEWWKVLNNLLFKLSFGDSPPSVLVKNEIYLFTRLLIYRIKNFTYDGPPLSLRREVELRNTVVDCSILPKNNQMRTTLYTLRVRYTYGAIYLSMRYVLRTRYVSQSETRIGPPTT